VLHQGEHAVKSDQRTADYWSESGNEYVGDVVHILAAQAQSPREVRGRHAEGVGISRDVGHEHPSLATFDAGITTRAHLQDGSNIDLAQMPFLSH
jgi:hypothetical protein